MNPESLDPKSPSAKHTKGEVKVWLTAVGLATGLIMIVGLLLVIAYNGTTVFWPKAVPELTITIADGSTSTVAGEIVKTQIRKSGDGSEPKQEIQLFVGNKDAYQLGFRFIDSSAIQDKSYPENIFVAERLEYGDSIFYPVSLNLADGSKIPGDDPNFESEFARLVEEGNDRRADILKIEKKEIGKINARIRKHEMQIRGIEKDDSLSPEQMEAAAAPHRAAIDGEQEGYEKLAAEATRLRAMQSTNQLVYRLSSGEERTQNLGDIIHFYRPNSLGFFAKVGVFIHHVTEFITAEPREANTEGGIFPAIFGTFVMTILMAVMVSPFGVVAAIYLREYASQGALVRIVRICVNNLAGVPSIVFGVFGLGFFVYGLGSFIDGGPDSPLPPFWWFACGLLFIVSAFGAIFLAIRYGSSNPNIAKPNLAVRTAKPVLAVAAVVLGVVVLTFNPYFSGFFSNALPTPTFGTGGILWASLTLSLMTLPVVIVATEEALAAVPRGIREAALACGASKWQTIQRIVLPSALPGVMTGVILAMARGAGEVAPLMITGVVKLAPSLPVDLTAPFIHADRKFMHLGFHIYDLGFQSPDSEAAKPMVFATTLLLIVLVVVMNLTAIRIRSSLRKKYMASAF